MGLVRSGSAIKDAVDYSRFTYEVNNEMISGVFVIKYGEGHTRQTLAVESFAASLHQMECSNANNWPVIRQRDASPLQSLYSAPLTY